MSTDNVKIQIIPSSSKLVDDCIKIRMNVFVEEQGYPDYTEVDGLDPGCIHFLATIDSEPVGTLRYFPPPKSKLGRLAVLKSGRCKGIAKKLIESLHEFVQNSDSNPNVQEQDRQEISALMKERANTITLNSQIYAIPIYQKYGYVAQGEQFDEDGEPHLKLVKTL